MPDITQRLQSLYKSHRIVFWYDEEQEFRQDFEDLKFDSVEKCEVKTMSLASKLRFSTGNQRGNFCFTFPHRAQNPKTTGF